MLMQPGSVFRTKLPSCWPQQQGLQDDHPEVCSLVTKTPQKGTFVFNKVISKHVQCGDLENARSLFDKMPDPSSVSYVIMLTGYGKAGEVHSARELFSSMPEKSPAAWYSMVTTYAQNGYTSEAFETFQRMLLEGIQPSKFSCLIKPPVSGSHSFFETFYGIVHECGLNYRVEVATILVKWLSKLGRITEAQILFHKVPAKDDILRTAMIEVYAHSGHLQEAEKMFDELQDKDAQAWNIMLKSYGNSETVQQAETLFEKIPNRNVVSWTTMVGAYVRCNLREQAIHSFCLMDLDGVTPNRASFLSVLEACGPSSVSIAKIIHSEIIQLGLETETSIATAILSMYGKCSCLEQVKNIFNKIACRNVVAWTSFITANAQAGHWGECIDLFRAMLLDGMQPNEVTLLVVLCACSRRGDLRNAVDLCSSMQQDFNVKITEAHYASLVDVLARAGSENECFDLIHHMPYHPGVVAWTNLLATSQSPVVAALAGERLRKL